MSDIFSLLNGGAVSIFGSVLSASFCNALNHRRSRRIFCCCVVLILLLQGIVSFCFDDVIHRKIYPVTTHLPLLLVLYLLTRKFIWPLISILSAYLCCQLRRWLALFAVTLLKGAVTQDQVELAITLPLLLLLLWFVAPVFRQVSDYPTKIQVQFGVIPALYYLFDYVTRVYTGLLVSGSLVAVEFMPFIYCAVYLVFLLYNSAEKATHNRLLQAQDGLRIQLQQSVREINALRESQDLAKQYRHDLRHHLQYLSSCIENGQEETALNYISGICSEIEAQKVQRYCENEEVNLILSAFAGRAEKEDIEMKIDGVLPAVIAVSDIDLCVLLSNALENAMNACRTLVSAGINCLIDVNFYERGERLFLQVVNSCDEASVRLKKGIPVSDQPGHGIGVQSILTIVERYGGLYSFTVENGQFILRVSL